MSSTDNQLTGAIPAELAQLDNLERLYLDDNQLIGAIPAELAQLFYLERLYLDHNQLIGAISAELAELWQPGAVVSRSQSADRRDPQRHWLNLTTWSGCIKTTIN